MLCDYQTWSKEPLMEAKDDGDLHGGQRSTEVKCSIFRIWFILFTLPFLSYEQYHQEIFSALKDQPKNLQKPVRRTLTYKDRK